MPRTAPFQKDTVKLLEPLNSVIVSIENYISRAGETTEENQLGE
jgi:hypothetical protein